MNEMIWKSGVLGVVVGDALGCPVQFESRAEVASHPVTGMRGEGTFDLPAGSWTDDSSLTLALTDSLREKKGVDLDHIMQCFTKWYYRGEYTPYSQAFDVGIITVRAIRRYKLSRNPRTCGCHEEDDNGNGSLMRVLPACLYLDNEVRAGRLSLEEAVKIIHQVGGLTHAHICSNIACGLYFFLTRAILAEDGPLKERLAHGLAAGFAFYEGFLADHEFLAKYDRLRDFDAFARTPRDGIRSGGYVVDTLEAALWSLAAEDTFAGTLLTAVNLGHDTDTVGAVAGGLAGLFYGCGAIPEDWLAAIKRREWIEELCAECAEALAE